MATPLTERTISRLICAVIALMTLLFYHLWSKKPSEKSIAFLKKYGAIPVAVLFCDCFWLINRSASPDVLRELLPLCIALIMFATGWIGITWKKLQHFFFQLSGIGAVTLLYALWNLFESCSLQVFPWSYFPCLLWVGCVCILARKRESLFRPIGVLGVCCTVLRNIIWLRSHFAAFSSDAAIQNWNLLLFVGYAVLAFALLTGTSRRDAKRYPLLEMICHAGVVFALLFQIDAQVSGDIRQTPIVCIALGLLLLSILFQYFWRMYKLRHLQVASDVRWTSLFLPTFAQLLVLLGFWDLVGCCLAHHTASQNADAMLLRKLLRNHCSGERISPCHAGTFLDSEKLAVVCLPWLSFPNIQEHASEKVHTDCLRSIFVLFVDSAVCNTTALQHAGKSVILLAVCDFCSGFLCGNAAFSLCPKE